MYYANTHSFRGTRDWWNDAFRERLVVPPSSHGRITHVHVSKTRRSSTTWTGQAGLVSWLFIDILMWKMTYRGQIKIQKPLQRIVPIIRLEGFSCETLEMQGCAIGVL